MNISVVHTIFFSPTHTSLKIADAIANGIGSCEHKELDITYEKPAKNILIEEGIAVISVPVYGGRVAETAVERLRSIRGNNIPAVVAVVYGNRDYEDALIELRNIAKEQGFIPVSGGAFIGEHSYSRPDRPVAEGRPDKEDIDKAFAFGSKTAAFLSDWSGEAFDLQVKGNFPYKVKGNKTPQTPITISELCTQCGYCIEICPTQAIELQDEIVSDPESCIKCCACVKECPNQARVFDTPFTDYLFKNFSSRRDPELFFY
ncbi:4Fe-4S binding protein [uncultured Coprobacter sp.]|jgi:hypothetical protein|uniref:4Fe-4S binding protein n=1 Tax=uncultured Coprobacter sp. TaxID=1720550 RepID=UPI0025EE4F36|nr:4Fe-4S binding protein [uncultured Coprobacter sp.]